MVLLKELIKIIKQAWGNEHIFGYKTPLANKEFLMYCLMGKIHFTDKLHRSTKYFWLIWHYLGIIIGYLSIIVYIIFSEKNDLTEFLNIIFVLSVCTFSLFFLPITSYWFAEQIEQMIQHIDDLPDKIPSSADKRNFYIDINRAIQHYYIYFMALIFNANVCTFDALFFYEDYKVQNYLYYIVPLPRLELYASKTFFFVYSFTIPFSLVLICIEYFGVAVFFYIWAASCSNEVVRICDNLEQYSKTIVSDINQFEDTSEIDYDVIEKRFACFLRASVDSLVQVDRRIKFILPYYESVTSIILPASFVLQVTPIYTMIVQQDFSATIIIREITLLTAAAMTVYYLCRIGEILYDMANIVSFEIYSMPWYTMPVKVRKHILILLCQAQETTNAKAMKMYPINGTTFMSFAKVIYSTSRLLKIAANR